MSDQTSGSAVRVPRHRGEEAGGPPFPQAIQGGSGHPRRHDWSRLRRRARRSASPLRHEHSRVDPRSRAAKGRPYDGDTVEGRDAAERRRGAVEREIIILSDFGLLLPVTHTTCSTVERRETRDITGGLAPPRPSTEGEEEEAQRVRRRTGTERRFCKGGHSTERAHGARRQTRSEEMDVIETETQTEPRMPRGGIGTGRRGVGRETETSDELSAPCVGRLLESHGSRHSLSCSSPCLRLS